jgi:uncharacterized protein
MTTTPCLVANAIPYLALHFHIHNIDSSHGIAHAKAVLTHVDKAIASSQSLDLQRKTAVRLAALLHDADDKKYFPDTYETLANARKIMEDVGADEGIISAVVNMISLVSCSSNGNDYPEDVELNPEILWPRWADRLEAIGDIGIRRCYEYTKKVGTPISCPGTPRCTKVADIFAVSAARFLSYKGKSTSMIDHFYDKLICVASPDFQVIQNRYLQSEFLKRMHPILEMCIVYSLEGDIGVEKELPKSVSYTIDVNPRVRRDRHRRGNWAHHHNYTRAVIRINCDDISEAIRFGNHDCIRALYDSQSEPRDEKWIAFATNVLLHGYTGCTDQYLPHSRKYGEFLLSILSRNEQERVAEIIVGRKKKKVLCLWKGNVHKK